VRGLARIVLAHGDTGDLQVLGVLLGNNVEGVVDRDDAQDMAVLIANGNRHEVVLGHLVGHELLIEVRGNPHHIAIRQVLEAVGVLGHHE